MQCPGSPEEGVGSPEGIVTDTYKQPCGFGGLG